MTKKDYVALAAMLKAAKPEPDVTSKETWDEIVCCLVGILRDDNPHFDRDRFLLAAGYF